MPSTDHRLESNITGSTLPPCSIHGMRGTSRKTSCDGLAKNITTLVLSCCFESSIAFPFWLLSAIEIE